MRIIDFFDFLVYHETCPPRELMHALSRWCHTCPFPWCLGNEFTLYFVSCFGLFTMIHCFFTTRDVNTGYFGKLDFDFADVEPNFVFKTEMRFSRFHLTSLFIRDISSEVLYKLVLPLCTRETTSSMRLPLRAPIAAVQCTSYLSIFCVLIVFLFSLCFFCYPVL